ncbi:uncharacterized protein LOC132739652 [Ruditapes philippinarum]|uniref:uncharacterized protein LOC132739652 n=1 Tax=Ruditapes philippinarum TaxID=129788 RepID=UPI00295B1753|nr:uncharacterized protein LOC132739652 [Ruditapes philippinarum]
MARNYIELVLIVVFIMMSQQIVSGNEETSGEDIIKMRKHEFSALCPYTDTCYTNASAKEENLDFGIKCCDACKCDHQCGLNCCPDMSVYFKNTEDLFKSKQILKMKTAATWCLTFQKERTDTPGYLKYVIEI